MMVRAYCFAYLAVILFPYSCNHFWNKGSGTNNLFYGSLVVSTMGVRGLRKLGDWD